MIYRGFPERLHHTVPNWVEPGALFHIRIRLDREKKQTELTDPALAQTILDSAKFYETRMRWHITLFLLMPDHLHAVLSFPRDKAMSDLVREWKRYHTRTNHVIWQEGFFDHIIRHSESYTGKWEYVAANPVRAGLVSNEEDWPWRGEITGLEARIV